MEVGKSPWISTADVHNVQLPCAMVGMAFSDRMWVQVMQLGWDGKLSKVGSLGGGPHACLLGALADRLLIARAAPAPAGLLSLEISPRHFPILHCLLLAWATLASLTLAPRYTASFSECAWICFPRVLALVLPRAMQSAATQSAALQKQQSIPSWIVLMKNCCKEDMS